MLSFLSQPPSIPSIFCHSSVSLRTCGSFSPAPHPIFPTTHRHKHTHTHTHTHTHMHMHTHTHAELHRRGSQMGTTIFSRCLLIFSLIFSLVTCFQTLLCYSLISLLPPKHSLSHMYTPTHTHTHTHTYARTYARTCTHACTQAHRHLLYQHNSMLCLPRV